MPRPNKTRDMFVKDAVSIHGDKYDYSEFIYVGHKIKGLIICRKCNNKFEQCSHTHIQKKRGCPKCNSYSKKTLEEFITDATTKHGNNYDYSKFVYINCRTKGIIICIVAVGNFSKMQMII